MAMRHRVCDASSFQILISNLFKRVRMLQEEANRAIRLCSEHCPGNGRSLSSEVSNLLVEFEDLLE